MTSLSCNNLTFNPSRSRTFSQFNLFTHTHLASAYKAPIDISSSQLRLPNQRFRKVVSAVVSEETAVGSSSLVVDDVFKLTFLEFNSWIWEVSGVKILVDPVIVGTLDFGVPWLYEGSKKYIKNFQLSDLPEVDCLLITQFLDDHCHLKTLKPLSEKFPNLRVIATPTAKHLLDPLFTNITYLDFGEIAEVEGKNSSRVRVKSIAGTKVIGPPWNRRENGYLVNSAQGQTSLLYEPHCLYDKKLLEKERADIVITSVIEYFVPKFRVVSGQKDAVELVKLLQAKVVVAMVNGDVESKGLVAKYIQPKGTVESFKELLAKELPDARVLLPTPGVPLEISAV